MFFIKIIWWKLNILLFLTYKKFYFIPKITNYDYIGSSPKLLCWNFKVLLRVFLTTIWIHCLIMLGRGIFLYITLFYSRKIRTCVNLKFVHTYYFSENVNISLVSLLFLLANLKIWTILWLQKPKKGGQAPSLVEKKTLFFTRDTYFLGNFPKKKTKKF